MVISGADVRREVGGQIFGHRVPEIAELAGVGCGGWLGCYRELTHRSRPGR